MMNKEYHKKTLKSHKKTEEYVYHSPRAIIPTFYGVTEGTEEDEEDEEDEEAEGGVFLASIFLNTSVTSLRSVSLDSSMTRRLGFSIFTLERRLSIIFSTDDSFAIADDAEGAEEADNVPLNC